MCLGLAFVSCLLLLCLPGDIGVLAVVMMLMFACCLCLLFRLFGLFCLVFGDFVGCYWFAVWFC